MTMRLQCPQLMVGFLVLACGWFLVPQSALAQTDQERIEELRVQIEKLEAEADQYRGNISSEQEKAASLQRDITILKNQISAIETQIVITNKSIDRTKLEIEKVQEIIFDTEVKISRQREGIGRLLAAVDRYDNESLLAALVKNPSLGDFFRQAHDVETVSNQLLALIEDLQYQRATLEQNEVELESKQGSLELLNQKQAIQRSSLGGTKQQKDGLLRETKGQEAEYQKRLAEVERLRTEFFRELRTLESKIVQGGLYLVHVKAEQVPPRKTKLFQWPEEHYRLTQGYGYTSYARSRSKPYGGAPHNGIDMAAGYGSAILAAGDGEIIANGANDGWGNWVAIKHPTNLVTLYSHMSALAPVRVGSTVKSGSVIGYEGATGNVTGSHLHFSVYREFFTYLNEAKQNQLYFNYFDGSLNPLDYL